MFRWNFCWELKSNLGPLLQQCMRINFPEKTYFIQFIPGRTSSCSSWSPRPARGRPSSSLRVVPPHDLPPTTFGGSSWDDDVGWRCLEVAACMCVPWSKWKERENKLPVFDFSYRRWNTVCGGNLFQRFCNVFSESSICLLGQHGCSTGSRLRCKILVL